MKRVIPWTFYFAILINRKEKNYDEKTFGHAKRKLEA